MMDGGAWRHTAQSDCSNQGMCRRISKGRRGEDFLWRGQFNVAGLGLVFDA